MFNVYPTAGVAKWLGVSSAWVRDHATRKEPRLSAVKVGKFLRFRPEDVEDFSEPARRESRTEMARERNQQGYVGEIGKKTRKWRSPYSVYVHSAEDEEVRKHHVVTLGLTS